MFSHSSINHRLHFVFAHDIVATGLFLRSPESVTNAGGLPRVPRLAEGQAQARAGQLAGPQLPGAQGYLA